MHRLTRRTMGVVSIASGSDVFVHSFVCVHAFTNRKMGLLPNEWLCDLRACAGAWATKSL